MKSFKTRVEADKEDLIQGNIPKFIMAGETGDILASHGEQNSVD